MSKREIRELIKNALASIEYDSLSIRFKGDIIRIEIRSAMFEGMNMTDRLTLVVNKVVGIAMGELVEYHLVIVPLTWRE